MVKTRKSKLENRIRDILNQKNPKLDDIITAVDDYENNNLKTIIKLKKKKALNIKTIIGGLKQCINSHGPITSQYLNSAAKRIYGAQLIDEKITQRNIYYTIFKYIMIFLLFFLA